MSLQQCSLLLSSLGLHCIRVPSPPPVVASSTSHGGDLCPPTGNVLHGKRRLLWIKQIYTAIINHVQLISIVDYQAGTPPRPWLTNLTYLLKQMG